jgi:predicted DsbA family dithiol-disulfide isomerase
VEEFQLDPTLDPEKPKYMEYFREKKGFPEAQAQQMIAQVSQMGKGAGIDFNFEKALITNTFSAHKLLHLAKNTIKPTKWKKRFSLLISLTEKCRRC